MPIKIEVKNRLDDRIIGKPVQLAVVRPGSYVALRDRDEENPGHFIVECFPEDDGGEVYFVPERLLPDDNIVTDALKATLEIDPVGPQKPANPSLINHLGLASLSIIQVENPAPPTDEMIDFILSRGNQ